jgi:hypothetical protein
MKSVMMRIVSRREARIFSAVDLSFAEHCIQLVLGPKVLPLGSQSKVQQGSITEPSDARWQLTGTILCISLELRQQLLLSPGKTERLNHSSFPDS